MVLLDFRGAGLHHTDSTFVGLLRESLSMCSRPELLHALYVLNVPGLVVGVWGLLSQVPPPQSQAQRRMAEPLSPEPPGPRVPEPRTPWARAPSPTEGLA